MQIWIAIPLLHKIRQKSSYNFYILNNTNNFELNQYLMKTLNYNKKEFKEDIRKLQRNNKKVLLSIGGEDCTSFTIKNDAEAEEFAKSTIKIIDEYNFNGVDVDNVTGDIDADYFEKAFVKISDNYGGNIMLTINSSCSGMVTTKQLEDKKLKSSVIGIGILAWDHKVDGLPDAYLGPQKIIKTIREYLNSREAE